jgi:uncharacterized protein YrrD
MLRSVEKLKGYRIQATDGEIGKVDELFFDERRWHIRYLVVDVGNWLFGRQVLIVPAAVSRIDVGAEKLFLPLTKERIENSPEVSADEPISREKERTLHEYYQWQPYWTIGLNDPLIYRAFPAGLARGLYSRAPKKWEEELPAGTDSGQSSNLRSTAEVTGYHIQASDGEIGQVTDFLFDDEEWAIRHLVVDTGNWLPGREVLISPPWIDRIRWAEQRVYVALTQDSVRHSPPFDPDLLDIEKYEKQLLAHYKKWFSYLLKQDNGQEERNMFLGKDIMGNPVITVSDGRAIGKVKDVYLTDDCRAVAGIYLGTEGLFSRQSFLVKRENVVTIGQDAVLVKHDDVVREEKDIPETEETWLRRDELQGRPVDTPGGTKVGKVGDVIINRDGEVLGFSLRYVYVAGPIADNHSVAINAVQDVGYEDGNMTVDLERAEQQELSVA